MISVFKTFILSILVLATVWNSIDSLDEIRWCVTHPAEVTKISDWNEAVRGLGPKIRQLKVRAIKADSPFDCMNKITHTHEADVVTLDGGQIYIAGRDHEMTVLMAETYPTNNLTHGEATYKSVAIVRTSDKSIKSLRDLRNKKSCHTGVGRTAGWNIPIGTLISMGIIEVKDCNNPVMAAADFFKESCAPLSKEKVHDREGTNPAKMCALCSGRGSLFCSAQDPFTGYNGAFKCLRDGGGDIAFAKGITSITMTAGQTQLGYRDVDFQLLCLDGSRASIYESDRCFWGRAPAHAVLVGRDMLAKDKAELMEWLETSQMYLGYTSKSFKMFDNPKYGKKNLIFKSNTFKLARISGKENYIDYLGSYVNVIRGMSKCSLRAVFMCTPSQYLAECKKLARAVNEQKLVPGLDCYPALDSKSCMAMIDSNQADVAMLSAKDTYFATKFYDLKPIFKEAYDNDMYAVAVVKRLDRSTNLKNLKRVKACFTGINDVASWLAPIFTLDIMDGQSSKNPTASQISKMAATLGESCVPGIKEASELLGGRRQSASDLKKLCSLCMDKERCSHRADEYAGAQGVLKCLRRGGGNVAFTVMSADVMGSSDDLELLCKDGTRAPVSQYMRCNLMMIPPQSMVVSKKRSNVEIRDITNLFRLSAKLLDGSLQPDGTHIYKMFGARNMSLFYPGTKGFSPIPTADQNMNMLGSFADMMTDMMSSIKSRDDVSHI